MKFTTYDLRLTRFVPLRRVLVMMLTAALLLAKMVSFAAPAPGPQISVSEGSVQYVPYDPPNDRQVKFEISCKEASQNGDGRDLMKGVKIKQFAVTGGNPQMIAEAPECVVDAKLTEFSSAGPLQVHAQDGRVFVSGTGFLFRRDDSTLVISNNAHSIIRSQTTNASVTNVTEIFSQRARFEMRSDATNGTAVYQMDVRVKDPKMNLTCEYLLAELPKEGSGHTNHLSHIFAETNVVMDFTSERGERTHATAEKAVYDYQNAGAATNEALELTGNPRVELTNGWMTADLFAVDRGTGKLRGQDNVHFHFAAQNLAPGAARTNAPEETDIYSDRFDYDMNTRLSQFGSIWSHVRVRDPRIQLDCETLTATLPAGGATNRLDHIVAEKNVSIEFPDDRDNRKIHANGQKAVYDYKVVNLVTNELLELTGNPVVQTSNPSAWMTADIIRVDRAQGRIWGEGGQHSVLKKQADEPAAMDTEIFSERFEFALATGLSVYDGAVRAYDPEMNLASKTMTIKLAKTARGQSNRVESVTAEDGVAIDFIQKAFAGGDITNLTALVTRLSQPAEGDAIGRYVSSQLTPATRALLANDGARTNALLRDALTVELNRLTQSGWLYEKSRFAGVILSQDTTTMLQSHPMGIDLVALNRLLLLDAFRGQLKRSEGGEKTHATGDHAIYSTHGTGAATNAVLELHGHPKLEKPDGWVTAEDEIIFDRTTGQSHFVGAPHFQMKFGGATGIKAPTLEQKGKK